MALSKFTQEEITAAKQTRDEIINGGSSELGAIYMAGEIVMWDELRTEAEKANELVEQKEKEIERLSTILKDQAYSIWKGCNPELHFEAWNKLFIENNNL